MGKEVRSKGQRQIEKYLHECGLSWSIEHGSKHRHVIVAGRLAGVISNGTSRARDYDNIIRNVEKMRRLPA